MKDDSSPTAKLALFGDDASRNYNPGDEIRVSEVYRHKNTNTLSTKKTSKIEVNTVPYVLL